jgi:hypothetical protein
MKCISAIALLALSAAPSLTNGLKHVVLSNGESRLLSAASSINTPKQDAGPKTKDTAVDTLPKVTNGGVNLFPYPADIRDYIVEAHNNARATLTPSEASNMRKLKWDESLAIEASELVNTCVFAHDTENYAYGQNLMYGGRTITTGVVDSWMDAWVKDEISPSDRVGNGFMDLDHASAVLWANSYLVGCASKMCPNGYLTACNYFTPGNWAGEKVYQPGPACSACPAQAPYCDASGKLCVAEQPLNPTNPTPAPVPAPTPAPTNSPVPGPNPTPAPTTGNPAQQNDQNSGNGKPTPSPTWNEDPNNSPFQRPIDASTPAPSDKWANFETSPATKPAMPSAIAALVGVVALARAL